MFGNKENIVFNAFDTTKGFLANTHKSFVTSVLARMNSMVFPKMNFRAVIIRPEGTVENSPQIRLWEKENIKMNSLERDG